MGRRLLSLLANCVSVLNGFRSLGGVLNWFVVGLCNSFFIQRSLLFAIIPFAVTATQISSKDMTNPKVLCSGIG